MGTILQMLQESTGSKLGDVSIGLQYSIEKMNAVDWPRLHYSLRWLWIRSLTLFWVVVPLGFA